MVSPAGPQLASHPTNTVERPRGESRTIPCLDDIHPEVVFPPEEPPTCCAQKTISVRRDRREAPPEARLSLQGPPALLQPQDRLGAHVRLVPRHRDRGDPAGLVTPVRPGAQCPHVRAVRRRPQRPAGRGHRGPRGRRGTPGGDGARTAWAPAVPTPASLSTRDGICRTAGQRAGSHTGRARRLPAPCAPVRTAPTP